MIDSTIEELIQIARPQSIYQIYDLHRDGDRVMISGTSFQLKGDSIASHLSKSDKCCLLAVTLGVEADRKIHSYQVKEMTRAVILDACASAGVENICQGIQAEVKALVAKEGQYITNRFSPGYGDFPIEAQGELLNLLKGYQRIGLTATARHLLIPRKSVTAMIGIGPTSMEQDYLPCDGCLARIHCKYRKGGISCGIFRSV